MQVMRINSAGNEVANSQGTLLTSAARTTTTITSNQTNYNARGMMLSLRVDVASGTGGLVVRIQAVDVFGNQSFINDAPTAITAAGTYTFEIYPGATTAGTSTVDSIRQRVAGGLPRTWRVIVTHGDATSYTYSLSYSLIL